MSMEIASRSLGMISNAAKELGLLEGSDTLDV